PGFDLGIRWFESSRPCHITDYFLNYPLEKLNIFLLRSGKALLNPFGKSPFFPLRSGEALLHVILAQVLHAQSCRF
ncbi:MULTISPECIES: hypothetical protein, partial [unclassified Acinetobacter]|uniref:hypothetical protein n=1 Tax=unclassified Acinetobacter TaxID=196816 RepID=UPI001D0F203C